MDEEKKDKRPAWLKKTNYGIGLLIASGILAAFPPATILVTLGSVGVTTHVLATSLMYLGNALGVYGIADRVAKK